MNARLWSDARKVRTLTEAHAAVVPLRPAPDAPRSAWVNFHRRSSAVYRAVAEVDQAHREHALYWANREHARAETLAAEPVAAGRTRKQRQKAGEKFTVPTTLEQAHAVLESARPAVGAPAQRRLAHHQQAAAVYAEVADVDRAHHHEALVWAASERQKAAKLAQQIEHPSGTRPSEQPETPGVDDPGEPCKATADTGREGG